MLFVNSGLFFRPFLSSIRIHSDAIWGERSGPIASVYGASVSRDRSPDPRDPE